MVNIDLNKAKLVGVDEILTTDDLHPILYTKYIKTCLCILIIGSKQSYMSHISNLEKFNKKKEEYKKILDNDTIKDVYVFENPTLRDRADNLIDSLKDKKDSYIFLKEVLSFFKVNGFYSGFLEEDTLNSYNYIDNCSIGYNDDTCEFYGIDVDNNFYIYDFDKENIKKSNYLNKI